MLCCPSNNPLKLGNRTSLLDGYHDSCEVLYFRWASFKENNRNLFRIHRFSNSLESNKQ